MNTRLNTRERGFLDNPLTTLEATSTPIKADSLDSVKTLYKLPEKSLIVSCLLLSEGKVTDGRDLTYTRSLLSKIKDKTETWLSTGEDSPIFLSDVDSHYYEPTAQVGKLLPGSLYIEEMTADTIPHPGMGDLIGKQAIFGLIALTADKGIERYESGMRKISVGLTSELEILEVSMVPWGASKGAMLLSKNLQKFLGDSPDLHKFNTLLLTHGLTIDATMEELKPNEMWKLIDYFSITMSDINDRKSLGEITETEAKNFQLGAITDLYEKMLAYFQLSTEQNPLEVLPMTTDKAIETLLASTQGELTQLKAEKLTLTAKLAEVEANLAAEIKTKETLETELAQSKETIRLTTEFSQLKVLAMQLVTKKILTPHQYSQYFTGNDSQDIQTLASGASEISIGNLRFYFEQLSKNGVPVLTNNRDDKAPVTELSRDSEGLTAKDLEAAKEYKNYCISIGKKTPQTA